MVCVVLVVLGSCENLLDNEPKSEINSENFYQTEQDALAAVFACYEYLGGGAFNDNFGGMNYNYYWVIQVLASDEGQKKDAVVVK